MSDRKPRTPTSFDVARLAGVSRSAVSRAYTDGAQVAEETRKKVFAAAEELGYRVNSLARGLQAKHSDIVGLVASRLDTPIRSRQIKLLTQAILNAGFRPMLITAERGKEVGPRLHSLLGYNVAGMIVTSDSPPPSIVEECAQRGIPLVLVNRDPDVPWGDRVQMDPDEGGRMVYRLLRDTGASRFACITPDRETFSVTGRVAAFVKSARGAGCPCLVIRSQAQTYAATRAAAVGLGPHLGEIDGVFCATDLMALGGLDALRHDLGVKVPRQIQVVGFDDIEQASWAAYDLTTIRQDIEEQCRLALDLLQRRLDKPNRPLQTRLLTLTPVLRGTTRKPK